MSTRWSYKVIDLSPDFMGRLKPEAVQDHLNQLGLQGWELVTIQFQPLGKPRLFLKKAS